MPKNTPLTNSALRVLPLLIEAEDRLCDLASPQASRLSERIAKALYELIEVAEDVEAYGNKWTGSMEEIAGKIRAATLEYTNA